MNLSKPVFINRKTYLPIRSNLSKCLNKCAVNCKGNYDQLNKCQVFRLPKDELEKQTCLNTLPPRENFSIDTSKFFICEKHWPQDTQMIKVPGWSRPTSSASILNIPSSYLPTATPAPWPIKVWG